MKRDASLPEPALALVVCAACLGGSAGYVAADALAGVSVPSAWPLVVIVGLYLLTESITRARPLAAIVAGVWATLALVTPVVVRELLSARGEWSNADPLLDLLLAVAAGAGAGLVLGSSAWLVRRLLKLKRRIPDAEPRPSRGPGAITLAAVAVVLVLAETAGWACQSPFAAHLRTWLVNWRGWQFFYEYDRLLLAVFAGVMAYAVLRRLRFTRLVVAFYLVAGFGITLARAVFFRLTAQLWPAPSLGHIAVPVNGYQYANAYPVLPSIPFDALVRFNVVELAVRAVAFAVGLVLLLRAVRRQTAAGPSQRG